MAVRRRQPRSRPWGLQLRCFVCARHLVMVEQSSQAVYLCVILPPAAALVGRGEGRCEGRVCLCRACSGSEMSPPEPGNNVTSVLLKLKEVLTLYEKSEAEPTIPSRFLVCLSSSPSSKLFLDKAKQQSCSSRWQQGSILPLERYPQ